MDHWKLFAYHKVDIALVGQIVVGQQLHILVQIIFVNRQPEKNWGPVWVITLAQVWDMPKQMLSFSKYCTCPCLTCEWLVLVSG